MHIARNAILLAALPTLIRWAAGVSIAVLVVLYALGCDVKSEPLKAQPQCFEKASMTRGHCMSGVTDANAVEQCTAQMLAVYDLCCEQIGGCSGRAPAEAKGR